jgi:hypothetical protein
VPVEILLFMCLGSFSSHSRVLFLAKPPLCCRRCPKTATLLLAHTTTTTLLPPPCCHVCHPVTIKLLPSPLPPHRRHRHHRHHCHWYCQAAAAATKLPLLPLSTLRDKFDNEKEFCNMTEVDFVRLSCLFQLGIKF